ncbi:MAG: Re/Si-specific NAD(P)(+) transhydrogenase subunit alpha [Ignavibacteria bacterium]|nr:Re/Si-specific NAD(P)(+) transhydrogenase subunit alpha [Ignavibacteria bacterium]
MVIGIPKEILSGENRVAITPDTASKLIKLGFEIVVETNAGLNAHFLDENYINAGAKILSNVKEVFEASDVICKVQRPVVDSSINELQLMKKGTLLISFFFPLNYPQLAKESAAAGVNVIAMDFIPRITRAQKMDALSSQSNLAGYKSVLLAANHLGKIFPLLMTAAGTITPAKVVIMGAGVAGLQALGTAKRLGAIVEVSDVRTAVKEEVLSLGGRFIEVEQDVSLQDERGYAKEQSAEFLQKQKEVLFKHITQADIVITTALIPGKKAPVLVTEEMVKNMKHGSVVLDMAAEFGGNCELSEMNKTVVKHGVTIIGETNLPGLIPTQASELYSKNILALLTEIGKGGTVTLDLNNDIVKESLISYQGEVYNQRIKPLV